MKRSVLIVLLLTLTVPCLAFGQAQTVPPPKPGPEVQRLGYFVGTWKYAGKVLTDPKGTYEGTQTWEWFPGGFSVVGKAEGTGVSGGPQNELMIMGYSNTDKFYPSVHSLTEWRRPDSPEVVGERQCVDVRSGIDGGRQTRQVPLHGH